MLSPYPAACCATQNIAFENCGEEAWSEMDSSRLFTETSFIPRLNSKLSNGKNDRSSFADSCFRDDLAWINYNHHVEANTP